jgi:hypothetical protein
MDLSSVQASGGSGSLQRYGPAGIVHIASDPQFWARSPPDPIRYRLRGMGRSTHLGWMLSLPVSHMTDRTVDGAAAR